MTEQTKIGNEQINEQGISNQKDSLAWNGMDCNSGTKARILTQM